MRSTVRVFCAVMLFIAPGGLRTVCAAERLRAGAARIDITPAFGVSLDGPISKNGPVTGIHDRLHARALVLDDQQTRLAIVICDACMIGQDVFDRAKQIVQNQSGLPQDRMLMAATHTHAAPRAVHLGTESADDEYHLQLSRKIAEAVLLAESRLAPARLGIGSFQVPELLACRRFLCEPDSVGPNPFGETGERIKSVSGSSSHVIGFRQFGWATSRLPRHHVKCSQKPDWPSKRPVRFSERSQSNLQTAMADTCLRRTSMNSAAMKRGRPDPVFWKSVPKPNSAKHCSSC